jgi:hypothetical protein
MEKYAGSRSHTGNYQQYIQKYSGATYGDYQQYMKTYAVTRNDASATELLEQPRQKSDDSSVGSELDLGATKSASKPNSNANYQKYMQQYAAGQGSYQKYMKPYAGDQQNYQNYMNKYAGSYTKYADFQKYRKRYQNDQHNAIRSAGDAKNKSQLDEWKSQSSEAVKWYVPEDYAAYAKNDIDKKYETRLTELDNAVATTGEPSELSETPPRKSDESSIGTELDLVATKSASQTSSNSNYQKYMRQYAAHQNSYPKYMKQYAGSRANYSDYVSKFAGSYEKYSDYRKYMTRYQNREHNEVRSAHDAKNKAQLDEWKSNSSQAVKWYVPAGEATYAEHRIDNKYETYLSDLDSAATTTEGPFAAFLKDLRGQPQTPKATRTFLAQADPRTKVATNMKGLAEQAQMNPATCAVIAFVGVALASLVVLALHHRRMIQIPEIMLG